MDDLEHGGTIMVAASGFIYAPRSSNNLGDRAQLGCSLERLRSAFPGWRLVALANSLNDSIDLGDLEVSYAAIGSLTSPVAVAGGVIRLPVRLAQAVRVLLLLAAARRVGRGKDPLVLSKAGRAALREIEEADALFLSGAGVFNDSYVVGVGGFWGAMIRCFSSLGKPVVASGQQIGPLERTSRAMLARWALRNVDLLGVRDPLSMRRASTLGIPDGRIVLTGDDAWSLDPASEETVDAILADRGVGVREPFIAAQFRVGASVGWSEADFPSFAAALDHLSAELDWPIVFVPTAIAAGHDDRTVAARLQKHLNVQSYTLETSMDAATTKGILGRASLAVGTAYHFCVFAASMEVPVLGLHARPYMEQKMVGLETLCTDRVAAVSRVAGLDRFALAAAARRVLQDGAGNQGDQYSAQFAPSPEEPVRVLARTLARSHDRSYSAKFAEPSSVEAYEQEFRPGQFMRNISRLEGSALRRALTKDRKSPFGRHLDFACGTGRAIELLGDLAHTTVGVDVSAAMLQYAQKRFPQVRFICGDISVNPDLLAEVGPFDLVTLWRFLASAEPELRRVTLLAIARRMDAEALLVVNNNANRTSLHGVALRLRARIKGRSISGSDPTQTTISHRELCRMLESAGLLVEETRAVCYLPEQMSRRLPDWLWMPVEQLLGRLNVAPAYSVNQIVLARQPGPGSR